MPVKRSSIVAIVLAVVAIPATVYLAQQQQLARKLASESNRARLTNVRPKSVPGEIVLKVHSVALPQPSQSSILSDQGASELSGRFSYVDGFKSIETILTQEEAPGTASLFSDEDKEDTAVFLKLTVNPSIDTDVVIDQLKADPAVLDAQPNYYRYTSATPNDADYINQWHLHDANDHDIDAPEAWDISTGSEQVTVAVIDSGVDYTHPDLTQKIAVHQQEFGDGKESNGIDDDGNGFIDDWRGWNFVHNTNDPMDQNGHGTHVSGIIGASTDNTTGVAGINWNAPILPVRVCGQSECSCAAIVSGIAYAADRAQVINMSLGGSMQCLGEAEAIAYAEEQGVVVVAAAGNSNTSSPSYPAYHETVIAVAALDRDDKRSSFSNFGEWVDIAAPGRDILSTILPGAQLSPTCGDSDGNGYATCSGTSMASPVVAGVVSLVMGAYPNLTTAQIRSIVRLSADSIAALNPGFEKKLGTGKVSAHRGLTETFFAYLSTPTNRNVYNQQSIDIKGTAWSMSNQGLSLTLEYSADGQAWQSAGISYPSSQTTAIVDDVIGILDTTNLANGTYTIRLNVHSQGILRQSTTQFTFDRDASVTVKEGWPVQCELCGGSGFFVGGASTAYNVSLGQGKGAIGLVNGPYLWDADGNKLPGWPPADLTKPSVYGVYKMMGDVNGDGAQDIFTLRKELNQQNIYEWRDVMTWYDTTGQVITSQTFPYVRQLETISPSGISTADLDGDGKSEITIMASRYVYEFNGSIYLPRLKGTDVLVYDTSLTLKWQKYIPSFTPRSTEIFSVGDTNGDGTQEIVMALTARSEVFPKASGIYGFTHDGQGMKNAQGLIKEYIFTGGETYGPAYLALADLNNDGTSEIVLKHSYIYLRVLDIQGTERFRIENPVYEIGAPAIGDLDGDGHLEIVFAATDIINEDPIFKWYAQLHAVRHDGTPYLKDKSLMTETFVDFYDYHKGEPWYYPGGTTLGDVSGDGKADIVTSWQPFDTIWAYSANQGGANGSIQVLPGWPVYGEGIFGYTTSIGVDTSGGGMAEVFALDWRDESFLYRFGTKGTLAELGRPWPLLRGSERFSGAHVVRNPLIPTSTPVAPTPTITPTPTYLPVPTQSPDSGQAISLDGVTSYVKIHDTTQAFKMPLQFTIEAWIKPSFIYDFQTIVGRISPSFGSQYRLNIFTNQEQQKANLRFTVPGAALQSDYIIPMDTWSHVAVSRDENTVKGYINGVKVFDQTGIVYNNDDEDTSLTSIGAWNTPTFSGNKFKGAIDDVRISNTAREVSTLWNTGAYFQNLPSDDFTMGLWRFDGTVTDSSSHGVSSVGEGTYTYVSGLIPPVVLTPTATSIPLPTSTPVPSATATPTLTSTPVPTATPTLIPSPTRTPTPLPTNTPTLTPTRTPTPLPSATPTRTPTPTLIPSSTPLPTSTPTAVPTSVPLRDTIGIFRPSNAAFYLRNSNTNGVADLAFGYGLGTDVPLVGDWNGDGVATPGIFRNGTFYLRNSNTNGYADISFSYGLATDIPVVGDWDGDGKDSIGVYRNGLAFLRNATSAGNADYVFSYGIAGDRPVAGDWDGDGKDTLGIFRSKVFYLRNANTSGTADRTVSMGNYDGIPFSGDWDANGTDGVGVFQGGAFTLINQDLASPAYVRISYGQTGDIPLTGVWRK